MSSLIRLATLEDVVASEREWETIGRQLLDEVDVRARAQGAMQTIVVCGYRDEPERRMLQSAGLMITSEWYVRNI